MGKYFILTNETKVFNGELLHRIVATKPFEHIAVAAGERGGFVRSEDNLRDNGWVSGDAVVAEDAVVRGHAVVCGHAIALGSASVKDDAWVGEDARVGEHAVIAGKSTIMGRSIVSGHCFVRNASVSGTVDISEYARIDGIDISIYGDATVNGHAKIGGYANIFDRAWIYGNAVISGIANIGGSARVHDHVQIDGDVHIIDPVDVVGNAIIRCIDDFVIMHNNWSSGRAFIWTRSNNKWSVGCFYGTGNALIKRAYKESEYKGKCYEAAVRYVEQLSKYREENESR